MSFAALHKSVTYLMAGLGLAALFLGGELSMPVELAIVFAFLGSFFAEGSLIHSSLWQRGWNLALLALLAIEVARAWFGEALLPLGLEFTAALQISRLCNRRTAAEHQQVTVLAFLHLCAATVLSTELAYALVFLGFVVVAPWMLALTHLRSEIEAHYRGDRGPENAAVVERVLASRRLVGPRFLAGTAGLSVPLFACTGVLFLTFPRVGLGLLPFRGGSASYVAGFGGEIELGQVGVVRDDPTVVLRVILPGLGERPPATVALRLRGTSFDRYDGRRWSRSTREPIGVGQVDTVYPILRVPDPRRDTAWTILLNHLQETVVFLPAGTVALEIPPRIASGYEIGRRLALAPGLDLRYLDEDALPFRYTAWVAPDAHAVSRESLDPSLARAYLQVPPGHERVADMARRWTEGARTDRERAERIAERLRTFHYSLEMRDPGGRLPLEAFLFEWRSGHCEYFSSAMAIMLRSLGIPSRNVTGFLGGRWNPYGRYYAITQGDAHSWVEAYLPGEGWVPFDPTPPGRGELDFARGIEDEIAAFLDALRTRWEDDILGYDLRAQRSLARRIGGYIASIGSIGAHRSALRGRRFSSPGSGCGAPFSVGHAVAVVAVLLGVVLLVRAWHRRRGTRSVPTSMPAGACEAVALYRDLERLLATLGKPRPPSVTPLEYADSLARQGFPHADAVRAITDRYLEARYGGMAIGKPELSLLRKRLRAIARASRT